MEVTSDGRKECNQEEAHGIATKVRIPSGNVSKRDTIEESTESARTGKLSANTMVNEI